MNDDKPKPRCCSECVYFRQENVDKGYCKAPVPWWVSGEEVDGTIHLSRTKGMNCDSFHPEEPWQEPPST